MDRGINELFEGLTITYGNYKYILPPSSFAEAEIGLMSQAEVQHSLEEVLERVAEDDSVEAPAIRHALKRGKGTVSLEDVLNRVKTQHEKRGKLITHKAVRQEKMTGGGVLFYEIERRGDSRKERNRDVKLEIDGTGKIIQYSCPCETHDTNFAKGNYDAISELRQNGSASVNISVGSQQMRDVSGFPTFVTHVACYHIAVALLHSGRTTGLYRPHFEFTKVAIFEALFMDVFRRIKEATIDDHLIRQSVLTEETVRQISEGELTLEVIKHMKNIDQRSQEIINGIKRVREKDGYVFSGFATDFRETPYQTASIVLMKQDGRSVHIVYDTRFGIELPFMMLNIPVFQWINMGRTLPTRELTGNPIRDVAQYFRRFNERTQQEVVSIITRPDGNLITRQEATEYDRAVRATRIQPQKLG